MKLDYICIDCSREINSHEYETLSDVFCPECRGHIVENSSKIWCFNDKNGKLAGPFYEDNLRKAFSNKEIDAQTKIYHLKNMEWKPLAHWDSFTFKSLFQPDPPVIGTHISTANTSHNQLLITCDHCAHHYSKRAKECPKCGHQPKVMCQVCRQKIPYDSVSCPECGDPKPFQPSGVQHTTTTMIAQRPAPIHNFQSKPVSRYAGFWYRTLALVIDTVISTIGMIIIILPLAFALEISMPRTASATAIYSAGTALLGYVVVSIIFWLYFTISESSRWQATLGKKLLGLRVTDEEGNRIGFGRANGRYWSKILSGITLCIGYLMVAFTKKKQGLHDKIAGTLVFKDYVPQVE